MFISFARVRYIGIIIALAVTSCITASCVPQVAEMNNSALHENLSSNYAVVKVYYGTNRKSTGNDSKGRLTYGSRQSELTLGLCEVSIPRDHRLGEIERPSILRLEFRENPEKHVVLLKVQQFEEEVFLNQIRDNSVGENREALVFVHGYNVEFEEAARRTAQMKYDLGFSGPALFYSWPSKGSLVGYSNDAIRTHFVIKK